MQQLVSMLLSRRVVEILKEVSDGVKTKKELRKTLNISSSALIQVLSKMTSLELIQEENGCIYILPKGKIILDFCETIRRYEKFLNVFNSYVNNYVIEDLPDYLVRRFYELSEIKVVEKDCDVLRPHKEFIDGLKISEFIYGYTAVFFPEYVNTFLRFAEEGKEIKIVVSKDVFRQIVKNYENELRKGLEYDNVEFYVSNRDFKFSFVVTDIFFSISFYLRNKLFDYKRDFICESEDGIRWGVDLFNYVVRNSVKVCIESLKELVQNL